MMTASSILASNLIPHSSELADWYDQECSATETSVQTNDYFHHSCVEPQCLEQSEHWRIQDLDEGDLCGDCTTDTENKSSSLNSQLIWKNTHLVSEPNVQDCNWEDVFFPNDVNHIRDSIIWSPPIKFDTMSLLKITLLSPSASSEESSDEKIQRTVSMLKNANATVDSSAVSVGTIYRRISHPDFSQNPTHWVNVTFDFQVGQENRLRMKIRRDIPIRWEFFVLLFWLFSLR